MRMEAFDVVTVTQGMDGTSTFLSWPQLSHNSRPPQIQSAAAHLRLLRNCVYTE
jgi:hypothetical protein